MIMRGSAMREWLMRLRAVLTPQVLVLLVAALLLAGYGFRGIGHQPAQTSLERRIEHALSQMAGAGRVSVVIKTRKDIQRENGAYMQGEEYPSGAVAVAQGASDPLIRLELQEALCALLGLPASAVSVIAGGE